MKEVLKSNVCYFATSSKDGKPNVVPMGFVEAVDDSEIMIVDVYMNKTRTNLAENDQVALAVTDLNRREAYQFKGKARTIYSGELFDKAVTIAKRWLERKKNRLQERFEKTNDPAIKAKLETINDSELVPNAVVLIAVKEAYPTIMSKV